MFKLNVLGRNIQNKNREDKSTALIKIPKFDENEKHNGYDVIGYDEWHERFNDIATWLEKKLGL